MPERLIPISESEQQFARLVERVFTDQEFADSVRSDPEAALLRAGFELDESQRAALREARRLEVPGELPEDFMAVPLAVAPVIRIASGLTRPATRPGVNVAVDVVAGTPALVTESTSPEFEAVPRGSEISRAPQNDTDKSAG